MASAPEIHRSQEIERPSRGQQVCDDHRVGVFLCSRRQRCRARRVGRMGIGTSFEQQPHDPCPVLRRGVVERRPAMLVARHAQAEKGRLASGHHANVVGAVERDRGPKIELRAVGEEIRRHVLPHVPEACRPAEDADLVIVAFAIDVSARLDEQPDRLQIAVDGREVERRCVVREIARVEFGFALDEKADRGVLVAQNREVQCGCFLETAPHCVDELRVGVQMGAKIVDIAGLGRAQNGPYRRRLIDRRRVALQEIPGEQLDRS
jgi:hypothetical protein